MDFLLAVIIMMSDDLHKAGYTIDKAELTCVAKNVYFESRGENITNKMYVASVTRNRLEDKRWPNTYCGVVNQKYQFSWTEENHSVGDTITKNRIERDAWRQSVEVAGFVMTGIISDYSNKATHYHRIDVKPKWSTKLAQLKLNSNIHIFYK